MTDTIMAEHLENAMRIVRGAPMTENVARQLWLNGALAALNAAASPRITTTIGILDRIKEVSEVVSRLAKTKDALPGSLSTSLHLTADLP